MSDCGCEVEVKDKAQRKVLYWLLTINLSMFLLEIVIGFYAQSTALVADSLDMLVDGLVYGIGIYAVGKSVKKKANAALLSGYFQAVLGILILVDILRRIWVGSEPVSTLIMVMGFLALIANVTCLCMIRKHKDGDVNMRASWIFSANDVIANMGVILGGLLVWLLDSRWPDIVVGLTISAVILRGSTLILRDARKELNKSK